MSVKFKLTIENGTFLVDGKPVWVRDASIDIDLSEEKAFELMSSLEAQLYGGIDIPDIDLFDDDDIDLFDDDNNDYDGWES